MCFVWMWTKTASLTALYYYYLRWLLVQDDGTTNANIWSNQMHQSKIVWLEWIKLMIIVWSPAIERRFTAFDDMFDMAAHFVTILFGTRIYASKCVVKSLKNRKEYVVWISVFFDNRFYLSYWMFEKIYFCIQNDVLHFIFIRSVLWVLLNFAMDVIF